MRAGPPAKFRRVRGRQIRAGANLVVPTLDDVALPALSEGRLEEPQVAAELRQQHTERP
jgi:hypothetical protein